MAVLLAITVAASIRQMNFGDLDVYYHAGSGKHIVEHDWYTRPDFAAFDLTIVPEYFFNGYIGYQMTLHHFIEWFGMPFGARLLTTICATIIVGLLIGIMYQAIRKTKSWDVGVVLLLMSFASLFLFRITLDKGQSFGIICLIAWLWSVLYKKPWLQGVSVIAYGFSHASFVLPLVLIFTYGGVDILVRFISIRRLEVLQTVRNMFTLFFPSFIGYTVLFFVHPERNIAIEYYKMQLLDIMMNPARPVQEGGEWYGMGLWTWMWAFLIYVPVLIFSAGTLFKNKNTHTVAWWLVCWICFAFAAPLFQSRLSEVTVPIAVIGFAHLFYAYFNDFKKAKEEMFAALSGVEYSLFATGLFLLAINFWILNNGIEQRGIAHSDMRQLAEYVDQEIPPGERIFYPFIEGNAIWYFLEDRNPLITGMGATYMYAKYPFLGVRHYGFGKSKRIEDIWDLFGAKYVIYPSSKQDWEKALWESGMFEKKHITDSFEIWTVQ